MCPLRHNRQSSKRTVWRNEYALGFLVPLCVCVELSIVDSSTINTTGTCVCLQLETFSSVFFLFRRPSRRYGKSEQRDVLSNCVTDGFVSRNNPRARSSCNNRLSRLNKMWPIFESMLSTLYSCRRHFYFQTLLRWDNLEVSQSRSADHGLINLPRVCLVSPVWLLDF